jgi:hypothetical protein
MVARNRNLDLVNRHTCPCCGYRSLSHWPGSFQICAVCYWEDCPAQRLDPWPPSGANAVSLVAAQSSYTSCGASERRFSDFVRAAAADDTKDDQWRPVAETDRACVRTPGALSRQEHSDLRYWCYWLHEPGS